MLLERVLLEQVEYKLEALCWPPVTLARSLLFHRFLSVLVSVESISLYGSIRLGVVHVILREICDGYQRISAFLTTKLTRSDRLVVCLSHLLELAPTSGPHTYSRHDLLRLYTTTRPLPAVVGAVRSHGLWTTCCLHMQSTRCGVS